MDKLKLEDFDWEEFEEWLRLDTKHLAGDPISKDWFEKILIDKFPQYNWNEGLINQILQLASQLKLLNYWLIPNTNSMMLEMQYFVEVYYFQEDS